MKRLSIIALSLFIGFQMSAQRNLFQNGNFDEQGAWRVVQGDVDNPVSVEFGSTDFEVNGGDGPNLVLTHLTVDEEQVFIYQELDLIAGKEYTFSLAINNLSEENGCWWCNLFWSEIEPVDGSDIDENKIAGIDAWTPEYVPGFDGLLDTFQTETKTDNIFIPEVDGVQYVGINFGSCEGSGDHIIVLDEIALIDPDLPPEETGIDTQTAGKKANLSFYPNPASTELEITYRLDKSSDVEISLINSVGQKVAVITDASQKTGTHKKYFDCSSLANGLYYGILRTGSTTVTKKIIISK